MLKSLTFFFLLFSGVSGMAQTSAQDIFTPPKELPDTLYFAFNEGVQLIVINHYDNWEKQVSYKDAMQPRGLNWASVMSPPPANIYIFRNKAGNIIKVYNGALSNGRDLKSTDYVNTNSFSLNSIQDYRELNKHLKFYTGNKKIGLINLKGEVVVPAIYDDIRKYQDTHERGDKLVIEKDSMFGLLDINLKVLFPPVYRISNDKDYVGYPEHNIINQSYLKVFKNGKCGLINEKGDSLIGFMFDDIHLIHDGLYVGVNYGNERDKNKGHWQGVAGCIVYDKNFSPITELKNYDQVTYSGIKRFIVKKDNHFGVLNYTGEVILPIIYEGISLQNGDYYVFKNNKSGMINLAGETVIPIEFERNMYFYGQAIYVIQDGLIGVYSNKYKLIAKPQFKFKTWEMGKYILTREDGSKGFVLHKNGGSYYQSPEGEITEL